MPLGGLTDEIDFKVFRSHVKIPLIFLVPAAFVVTLYVAVYLYANSGWFLERLTSTLHAQLGGQFQVRELVVDPTLTNLRLYGVEMQTPEHQPVVDAEEVIVSIRPLVLLARRLSVDEAIVRGAHVRIAFDEDGKLGLLEALGVGGEEPEQDDDSDSKRRFAIEFTDIKVEDSKFSFSDPDFRFHAPSVDIPKASIAIEPETLLMSVDRFDVPEIDFVFSNELLRFPEEAGDWTFKIENAKLRKWRWANDGFNVESVSVETQGVHLEAQGQMAFPGGEGPDSPTMTYDASASLSAQYWSPLAQYFLDEAVHFEVPELRIAAKGSLDEIDGAAKLYASRLETAGLHFQDVRATIALADQWLDIGEASANIHGGTVEIPQAFFNIFSIQYGAQGRFEGVNPRSLLNDFGVDLDFIDGRASGGFELVGGVPMFPDEPSPLDPYKLRDFAHTRFADVTVTEEWKLERNNQLLAPASTLVLQKGASTWVNMDRVVIPRARVRLDEDTVHVDDFRFDYQDSIFEKGPDGQPIQITAYLADLGPWTSLYGIEGVQGPVVAQVSAAGPLASPELMVDLRNRQAPIRVPGTDVQAEDLRLRFGLNRGRLSIHDASVETRLGNASLSGWIDLLLAEPPAGGSGESAFALRRIQPAQLEFSAQKIDVGAIAALAGIGVPVKGVLTASGKLGGTLQDPDATFEADIKRGQVLNQSVPMIRLKAGMRDERVVVDALEIDAAGAGKVAASGHYGFDGGYGFELDANDISLSQVAPLQLLPSAAQPRGRARVRLHGEGSLDEPSVGGDLQLYEFNVGERKLGDLALVVNTVDDTIYIAGAALPLATLRVELPMDADSPYYLRLGMEELDLSDAISELADSPVVSQALATGMVEVFIEKDFSRYQLLSYLTKLEILSLGRTIKNRGPLVFGLNNGEVFQVQQATIGTGDRYVSVEGALVTDPLLLDVKLDGQIDLSMLNTLRRALPDVFPAAFIESSGALEVEASFRGAPDELIADGRVGFQSAEVALRGLSDPVRVDSGEVRLERDRVFVSEEKPLSGSALGGVFNLAGELLFEGRQPKGLDVRAWSHNMNYRVPNTANLTFDTDIRLEASDIMRPETWLVGGRVDVIDGNFYRDISLFEQEVTGRVLGAFNRRTARYEASIFDQMPALEDIRFDLSVRARDGFAIRNQIDRLGLDLELRVDVRLQDTLAEPYVTGDVEVVDGLVSFQGEEFRVRSGTVRFSGEPANPWIDVSAGADIRNRCREGQLAEEFQTDMTLSGDLSDNEEQYYHVMLNLQGYADNLDIQFESNPYADQRDILSLLLTGCTVDQLTASSASGPTLEIALGPLLGRIEKEIQDVVKVSEFTIMPGVERTQVRIGDRLTRRLSWNFQLDTGMSETAGGQRSQLEYKLSDRWSAELSGERNQTETNNFLLDLKLKYRLPLE
jgi:hypothetical protein